ncbi:anaphase-promoting complex subunit 2 [Cryptococcus neoformans]|nr:anaphase-promoting complex subunit 2 [Cryptococcus neoformans var. grubii]
MAALQAALLEWDMNLPDPEQGRIALAVEQVRKFIYPRNLYQVGSAKPQISPEISHAFAIVKQYDMSKSVFDDFLDDVENNFELVEYDVLAAIQGLELPAEDDNDKLVLRTMSGLFERLATWQRSWGLPLRAFQDNIYVALFTRKFHHLLHSSFPPSFPDHLLRFLHASLASLPEYLTNPPPQQGYLQSVPINYQKVLPPTPHLSRLGIFPRYAGSLSKVAHEEIERIAREEAGKGWGERRLGRARQRIGDGVANWLSGMFEGNEAVQGALRPMFSRFDYFLCKCFFDTRTDELFDIIIDFPDSMAALEDLKECLFKVDQRLELVNKLNAANLKRLLHPGAETHVILNIYISTIRSLRILDPLGVLLHAVALPIREHLRKRPDTIKCIVEALVQGEELQDENEGGLIGEGDSEAEDFNDPRWEPEPADAAPEFRSGKTSDIVSTLVSIFGTKEVIVKELQNYLAGRLLQVKNYDVVHEVRTIELLKLRFGESALAGCDVMVKDVADSKRIDGHVQEEKKSVVHPLVLSKVFWPNMPRSSLKLPSKLQKIHAEYESSFHIFKPDKHLRFVPHLGTLSLTISLSDRIVTVDATPLQASIMELFEKQDVWMVDQLVDKLGVGRGEVGKALGWWAERGVVKDEGAKGWRLLEFAEEEFEGEQH